MDLESSNKISLKQLQDYLMKATPGELSYLLGRYGGPHNVILREKKFEREAAARLQYLINMQQANKLVDDMLLSE